ncbi:hypothetical protein HK405_004620, partial [Cladochytrium tenue]
MYRKDNSNSEDPSAHLLLLPADGASSSVAVSGDLQERIEREGAESDATYFLGADDGERRRLHVQALLEDPQAAPSVFDSGCGPGPWTLEMAIKFPHATFVGG